MKGTFKVAILPQGTVPVNTRFVFKIERKVNGSVDK